MESIFHHPFYHFVRAIEQLLNKSGLVWVGHSLVLRRKDAQMHYFFSFFVREIGLHITFKWTLKKFVTITTDKSVSIKSVTPLLTRDCLDNTLVISFDFLNHIISILILGPFQPLEPSTYVGCLSMERSPTPAPLLQQLCSGRTHLAASTLSYPKMSFISSLVTLSIMMSSSCLEPSVAAHCLQPEFSVS